MNKLDAYWDFLIDNYIVMEDALQLVTNINGFNKKTLDDVLYCQTGFRSVDQFCDEMDMPLPDFVNESKTACSVTDRILSGMDIKKAVSIKPVMESPKMYMRQRTIEVVLPGEEPFYVTLSVPGNMKNPKGFIHNWVKTHLPSSADWDYNESKIMPGRNLSESGKRVNADSLKKDLEKAVLAYMTSEGFDEKEARQYANVSVRKDAEKITADVGAELSYDGLMDLSDKLDKVIIKYDPDAYFEAEDAGLLTAVIWI